LTVSPEKLPSGISKNSETYARAIGFYSLRQNQLVEATLEIVHLGTNANWSSAGFQSSLVGQVAGGVPSTLQLSGHTVYEATATGSGMTMWFDGPYFYVLSIRSDYKSPRSLLESALGVSLA
jgi:hypothetical protein